MKILRNSDGAEGSLDIAAFEAAVPGLTATLEQEAPKPADEPGAETSKPVETPKESVKPLSPAEFAVSKQSTLPPTRNFEELGVSDAEIPLLKKMGNDSFAWVSDRIKELKKIKSEQVQWTKEREELVKNKPVALPDSWFEHPDAYTLDPKYREAAQTANQAAQAKEYWQQQFARIRRGEDWQDVSIGSGGEVITKEIPASAEAELTVMEKIREVDRIYGSSSATVQQLQQAHNGRHQSLLSAIRAEEDRNFPLLKEKPESNKYFKTMHDALDELGLHGNPLTQTTSKMYAFLMEQIAINHQLREELEGKKTVKEQSRRAGPTGAEINNGATKETSSGAELDVSEFEAYTR